MRTNTDEVEVSDACSEVRRAREELAGEVRRARDELAAVEIKRDSVSKEVAEIERHRELWEAIKQTNRDLRESDSEHRKRITELIQKVVYCEHYKPQR